MLPRKSLVPLKKEFERIRVDGKLYDSPLFGLMISFQKENGGPKAAFIVSKKIDKRSVVRHLVKRKISDAVSPFLMRLPKNLEMVFLAKKKATESPLEEISQEIDKILQRARLL